MNQLCSQACQVSKWLEDSGYKYHVFEASYDHMKNIRYLSSTHRLSANMAYLAWNIMSKGLGLSGYRSSVLRCLNFCMSLFYQNFVCSFICAGRLKMALLIHVYFVTEDKSGAWLRVISCYDYFHDRMFFYANFILGHISEICFLILAGLD